jgi:hypothetical protein
VPIDDSGRLSVKLVKNGTLKVIAGAPHGLCTTHADAINQELLAFFRNNSSQRDGTGGRPPRWSPFALSLPLKTFLIQLTWGVKTSIKQNKPYASGGNHAKARQFHNVHGGHRYVAHGRRNAREHVAPNKGSRSKAAG